MNSQENSTGLPGFATTRRAFLVGTAALPAMALPLAGQEASSMETLIEAHRAARAVDEALYDEVEALSALHPLPSVRVVTGVDHFTKEPCMWAHSAQCIDKQVAERKGYALWGEREHPKIDAWGDRKKAELKAIEDEYERIYRESGLRALCERHDDSADAEFDAFEALVKSIPESMADYHLKMAYLRDFHKSQPSRLESWIDELIGVEREGESA